MKRIVTAALSILVAASVFTPSLRAAPITGSIDFAGVVTFDSMSLANATQVTQWNSSFVLQDSGSFSSIAPGTNVTMAAPWIFNPSTATPSLWSVGNFKFDLASSVIVSQSASFLNITGLGTLSGNGFDPTPGTFSFTVSDSNGQNQSTFGFQAQSSAVPEPSTLALLGAGVAGLISARKRRARA
jgi:PEP-CTERM motif